MGGTRGEGCRQVDDGVNGEERKEKEDKAKKEVRREEWGD